MVNELAAARQLIASAEKVVSFSGAGLSAESGIATFRDPDGVWNQIDPTIYASADGFTRFPNEVHGWYAERRRSLSTAQPNPAHLALAAASWLHVTQNVDDLLERAGAARVIHLHGVLDHDRCHRGCGFRTAVNLADPPELEFCPDCGDRLRPDVVWFGEELSPTDWNDAATAIAESDVVIAVGTSGEVWPAAGLLHDAEVVVSVNTEPTRIGRQAAIELIGPAGSIIPAIVNSDPQTR